jgi:hypothetical protein
MPDLPLVGWLCVSLAWLVAGFVIMCFYRFAENDEYPAKPMSLLQWIGGAAFWPIMLLLLVIGLLIEVKV